MRLFMETLVPVVVYLMITYYLVRKEVAQRFKELHIKIGELDKRLEGRIHNNQLRIGRVEALNDVRYLTLLKTKTISTNSLPPEKLGGEEYIG
jgi:hypothetical protein